MEQKGEPFTVVGPGKLYLPHREARPDAWRRLWEKPILSALLLGVILCGCLFAELLMNHDPGGFYLEHLNEAPNAVFYFGTDALGRDLFSIVWYGGRVSLLIGILGAAFLTGIAVVYGCISGMASGRLDALLMRGAELLGSIPVLLLIMLLASLRDEQSVWSIAFVIGVTGWMGMARIVRSEVRQIQSCEYVLASRLMGGGFFHVMRHHLAPNLVSSLMFMVVSSIGTCMTLEATLSFLGLGLPVEVVSWGSMLSLSNRALLTNSWWVILIPGAFLLTTLLCITQIGNFLRKENSRRCSNL